MAELVQESKQKAKEYVDKYGKGNLNDWSGLSIKDKTETVGLTEMYEEGYWWLSNFAHSNIIAALHYVRGEGIYKVGPQRELFKDILRLSFNVYRQSIIEWNNLLGINADEQLTLIEKLYVDNISA